LAIEALLFGALGFTLEVVFITAFLGIKKWFNYKNRHNFDEKK